MWRFRRRVADLGILCRALVDVRALCNWMTNDPVRGCTLWDPLPLSASAPVAAPLMMMKKKQFQTANQLIKGPNLTSPIADEANADALVIVAWCMCAYDIIAAALINASIAAHRKAVSNIVPTIWQLMHILHCSHCFLALGRVEWDAGTIGVMNNDKWNLTGELFDELGLLGAPFNAGNNTLFWKEKWLCVRRVVEAISTTHALWHARLARFTEKLRWFYALFAFIYKSITYEWKSNTLIAFYTLPWRSFISLLNGFLRSSSLTVSLTQTLTHSRFILMRFPYCLHNERFNE